MSSNGSRRFVGLLVLGWLVGACLPPGSTPLASGPAEVPTASALPSEAAVASPEPSVPPTEEPTVEPTPELTSPPITPPPVTPPPIDPDCPQDEADDVISVQEFVDAKHTCFENGIRVRGWLDTPPPIGFLPPIVKPGWIYYPSGDFATMLWHQPPPEPDHVCASGEDCWSFFPHLDPKLDIVLEPLERWVILTGHTRDPRAKKCHYDGEGPNPNPEVVASCLRSFVVEAVDDAP
jgi:hypothetical protein